MTYLCTFRSSVNDSLLLADSTCLLTKNQISSRQTTSKGTVYKRIRPEHDVLLYFCPSRSNSLGLSSIPPVDQAALPPNNSLTNLIHSQAPLHTAGGISPTKFFPHQPCHHLLDPLFPNDRISRVPHLLIVREVNSDKGRWYSRLLRLEGF